MSQDTAPRVRVDHCDEVAVVVLDRPDKRNAIDGRLLTELRSALADLDADETVGAIVLTGAGPVFCAGMDLGGLGDLMAVGIGGTSSGPDVNAPWPPLGTPLIGAINGPAITGGLELALHCDILIGSPAASFADTHGRVGLVPGWGLSVLLPLVVGRGTARRMSLTGDFLGAKRAYELGLLTAIVEDAVLVETAVELGHAIASNDPRAVATYLSLYRELELESLGAGYAVETATMRSFLDEKDAGRHIAGRKDAVVGRGREQSRGAE